MNTYQYLAALDEPFQEWAMQRLLLLVVRKNLHSSVPAFM